MISNSLKKSFSPSKLKYFNNANHKPLIHISSDDLISATFKPVSLLLLISVSIVMAIAVMVVDASPIYATVNSTISNISTTEQISVNNDTQRIALIENKFTYAAYQNGSFYNFYALHSPGMFDRADDGLNTTVTENLDMLKDRPIPDGPFPFYLHPEYNDIPYIEYFYLIHDLAKRNNTIVTNLTDMDVDQGKIFQEDGKNAYDVLILFHNEYISQPEYDNLKKFVENGGTILFTEGNILYAQVDYDKTNNTITLVKGHNWEYDGKSANNSVPERWLVENSEWMGSNFLIVPSFDPLYFKFNPFNYTHTEEQYVTNPNATILIDYQAYGLPEKYANATIATYEMEYGKGKVIHLGLWGHIVRENPVFVDYMDRVLIPLALGENVTAINNSFLNNASYYSNNSSEISTQSDSESDNATVDSESRGTQGEIGPQGPPGPQGTQGEIGPRDLQDLREPREKLDLRDLQDLREPREKLDLRDLRTSRT